MPIQVVVIEDDSQVRKHLEQLINDTEGLHCIGSYGTGEAAVDGLSRHHPDVALLDINLPGISGIECVHRLKERSPQLQVVMLTVSDDSDKIFQALQQGASGYLLKSCPPSEILRAIHEVHAGGAPMSGYIARKVVQSFQKQGRSISDDENVSPREQEILGWVAKGFINKEIADILKISTETVRSHLKSIYEKMHVRSRAQAVAKRLRLDI